MITKISKSQYEEGHLYLFNDKNVSFINGPDGPMSKWLASLGVDEISDYEHVGCFIRKSIWESPTESDIERFIEIFNEDPQFRLRRYKRDQTLSDEEYDQFKSMMIDWGQDPDTDYCVGTYQCTLEYEGKFLVLFQERTGHSFDNLCVDFCGVFESEEDGVLYLYPSDEFLF